MLRTRDYKRDVTLATARSEQSRKPVLSSKHGTAARHSVNSRAASRMNVEANEFGYIRIGRRGSPNAENRRSMSEISMRSLHDLAPSQF